MADENTTRYVPWDVHKSEMRRIDEENERQNERLSTLERSLQEIGKITVNVEKLATNIETMTEELKRQGARLTEIESKPTKRWDAVITGVIGAVVGALGAAVMSGLIK